MIYGLSDKQRQNLPGLVSMWAGLVKVERFNALTTGKTCPCG